MKVFFFFALSSLNFNSLGVRLKACVCSPWICHVKNISLLQPDIISPPLNPSLEQHNRLNAHPIMNLLFRQLTESRSAPVDEILAQNYQYVSQVHQLCNYLNLKASLNFFMVRWPVGSLSATERNLFSVMTPVLSVPLYAWITLMSWKCFWNDLELQ